MATIPLSPGDDIQQACKTAAPGDIIYLRAGTYRNADYGKPFAENGQASPERTKSNLALISMKGTQSAPITIASYPGEKATLESDVSAFALKNCEWVNIEDIEFKGRTEDITFEIAIALWWLTDARLNQTGANGISINTCFNVNIRNCVIHNWPGSGINENYSEYINVEDCIIAHNARWSVGGVHGYANSKPGTGLRVNENDVKMAMRRNLVIDSQQCIPSRVTAKGFAELTFDEGGGLHTQAQTQITADGGVIFGKWEITDNLILFCGKSGINQNGTGNLLIERNSLYQNVQNTSSADIHLSPPGPNDPTASAGIAIVRNNIVHSLPTGQSINRLGDPAKKYEGIGINYVLAGNTNNADYVADSPVEEVTAVFQDPANNNFKRHASIPVGNGCPDDVAERLIAKAIAHNILIAPCPIKADAAFLEKAKLQIFKSWPDPSTIPEFGTGFKLKDEGAEYTFDTRQAYISQHDTPATAPTPAQDGGSLRSPLQKRRSSAIGRGEITRTE